MYLKVTNVESRCLMSNTIQVHTYYYTNTIHSTIQIIFFYTNCIREQQHLGKQVI